MSSDYRFNLTDFLERVDIVELISEYVALKKNGENFKGLCPFHHEKTPSFYVNPKKGLFHCFGCDAAGNAISFVMKYNNFNFKEALEFISNKFNIALPSFNEKKEQFKELYNLQKSFSDLSKEYLSNKQGIPAREYLKNRGIGEQTIEEFELGYLPEEVDLSSLLSKFNIKDIKTSGLFLIKKDGIVSRFNGRLIIPIKNIFGQIVAFSGRSLGSSLPKYLNSPETPIFRKGQLLYNLDKSKNFYEQMVFIVEGYFDVITLYQSGFIPVISTMGTAITMEHAKLIKRYFTEALLIFDGDAAGVKAAFRALDIFINADFIPSVVFLPENEDPDSYLKHHKGSDFENLIAAKEDLFIAVVKRLVKLATDVNKKVALMESLKLKLKNIKNPYRIELYASEIATLMGVSNDLLLKNIDINRTKTILSKGQRGTPQNQRFCGEKKRTVKYLCEFNFIKALFELPDDVISDLLSDMSEEYFNDTWVKKIYKKIIEIIKKGINIRDLVNDMEIGERLSSLLLDTTLSVETNDYYSEALKNKNKIVCNWLTKKRKEKIEELKGPIDDSRKEKILLEINELINKQKKLDIYLLED